MSDNQHPAASLHGPVEEVFDGIWFVRGQVIMKMGLSFKFGRAMTVVGTDGGELVLFNSMRLSEQGLSELDALGKVAHVVRLAGFHGRDDAFYRDRYGARVWAVKGQRYVRGMKPDGAEVYMEPDEYVDDGDALPVGDARLIVTCSETVPEGVCLVDREGGILIAGDSLQNMAEPDEFTNFLSRVVMKRMGFFKPCNVGPGWLKAGAPSVEDLERFMALRYDSLLPAHGTPVLGGASDKYRLALQAAIAARR